MLICKLSLLLNAVFLDAYNHSLGLMEKLFTFPEKSGNNKAISIAVHLCPLNVLLEQTKRKLLCFGCHDIGTSLTSRCSQLFSDLKEVALKAEAVSCTNNVKGSADSSKLQEFASIVWKYQEILKSRLKKSVYLGLLVVDPPNLLMMMSKEISTKPCAILS